LALVGFIVVDTIETVAGVAMIVPAVHHL